MNEDKRGRRGGLGSRTNAWISVVVSALIVFVATSRIFEPHDYPAGDQRNEPLFWVVVGVVSLLAVSVSWWEQFGRSGEVRRPEKRTIDCSASRPQTS
jgi:Co/Zn/Cd efflux system component